MNSITNRRDFIKKTLVTSAALAFTTGILHSRSQESADFPVIDYHVHLKDEFTIEKAVELAKSRNMKFGIVEHPGEKLKIKTDTELKDYIENLRQYPVYVGLQPYFYNWADRFSEDLLNKLDYVLMDADLVPNDEGKYWAIYRNDVFIKSQEEFVELYMNHIMNILSYEPITIFARPTFLPLNFARNYNEIWTKARMMKIIDVARERKIALEIQENTRVPSAEFIMLAKKAGVKFTFGTNARNNNAGNFNYCFEMAEKCGLTKDNMFIIE